MSVLRLLGVRVIDCRSRARARMAGLVLVLGIGTGCTSAGGERVTSTPGQPEVLTPVDGAVVELTRSRTLNHYDLPAPVEQVWNAMMDVHAAIGIPINSFDTNKKTAMFVGQNRYRQILDKPASLFLDCGVGPTGPAADSYRLMIRVHHALAPSDDPKATVLTSGVEAFATNPGVSGDQVPCASSGRLERDIAALIEARLKQKQ